MRAKKVFEVIKESIAGGAGGAGYAVWGGGWGRTFGNPSMGGRFYGRGFGFGQGSSKSGGPNLMYTYSIKPLDPILQQPGTPQGDDRYIHVGSKVQGKVLGKNQIVKGKIISSQEDGERNIIAYTVLDDDTGVKLKVDPTSVKLIDMEQRPKNYMGDIG